MSLSHKKHFFFDLDNTLTRSRSLVSSDMRTALTELASIRDVTVVSGAQYAQIKRQLSSLPPLFHVLSQNGNEAFSSSGEKVWDHPLSAVEKKEIFEHIVAIKKSFPEWSLGVDDADRTEDRGSQISFSVVGHHAPIERKEAFDPTGEKRKNALVLVPLSSPLVEVKVAGTTCFDYFARGRNKGFHVQKYVDHNGWSIEDSVYIGDQLYPGGNDDSVIGVCETKEVSSPDETLTFIRGIV